MYYNISLVLEQHGLVLFYFWWYDSGVSCAINLALNLTNMRRNCSPPNCYTSESDMYIYVYAMYFLARLSCWNLRKDGFDQLCSQVVQH